VSLRLAIFSANYNAPAEIDAFRRAMFNHFVSKGVETLFVQATDFFSDVNSISKSPYSTGEVVAGLKNYKPSAVIFLNGAGRTYAIQDMIASMGIPSLTWFWDHPAIHSSELLNASERHSVCSVNRTFIEWFENRLGDRNVKFLPFPCFGAVGTTSALTEEAWRARSTNILFMGTLWDPGHLPGMLNRLQYEKQLPLERDKMMKLVEKDVELRNRGLRLTGSDEILEIEVFRNYWPNDSLYLAEANNHFSGRDRLARLRVVADLGLSLYGPVDCWWRAIEGFTPELRNHFRFENVSDPKRLMALCRDAKIGLNSFHRQNQGGGTNFRFNEYALAETPIVSDRNAECERVFKHGEAAFYFGSEKELRETCAMLLDNPALAVRAARAAKEIALSEFNMEKVGNELFDVLGISFPAASLPANYRVLKSSISALAPTSVSGTIHYFFRQLYRWGKERGFLTLVAQCAVFFSFRLYTRLYALRKYLETAHERRQSAPKKYHRVPAEV